MQILFETLDRYLIALSHIQIYFASFDSDPINFDLPDRIALDF